MTCAILIILQLIGYNNRCALYIHKTPNLSHDQGFTVGCIDRMSRDQSDKFKIQKLLGKNFCFAHTTIEES